MNKNKLIIKKYSGTSSYGHLDNTVPSLLIITATFFLAARQKRPYIFL